MSTRIFAAYPASPTAIGDCMCGAVDKLKANLIELQPWQQNDICGIVLTDPIFSEIDNASALVADITKPNFNVTFEIGYAIAKGKPLLLVVNAGLVFDPQALARIGIFDTIGYEKYENSKELADRIASCLHSRALKADYDPNHRAPVYLVEMPRNSEAMTHIVARVKKSRLKYRSFNLREHVRLSATDAISHTGSAFGCVVPLAPGTMPDADDHNIRAAFVAGLSIGFGKPTLILQDVSGPFPADAKDLIHFYRDTKDIDDGVADFALDVVDAIQGQQRLRLARPDLLSRISLGDPMAENEFETLADYYVPTDPYQRALRGEVNLVVGRKGTGKTALFSQVRNAKRDNKANIVVDLKPEGYQLVRLKEEILDVLSEGSRQHLVTIFWEYVLYLEICYKILEKDRERHKFDHTIRQKYQDLAKAYAGDGGILEGDFSERLLILSESVIQAFKAVSATLHKGRLSVGDVSNIVYRHDIRAIRDIVADYIAHKDSTWILFDNLDKGWPSHGLQPIDITILRCLVDAARKIQREMTKREIPFTSIVFIRNDVFELLMQQSADFGKEMRVSLDWSDADLLRDMIARRIRAADPELKGEFEAVWTTLVVSHCHGEDSFFFLLERSLMRPRNLIKLIMHCRGAAVNLGHNRIAEGDIKKGLMIYSNDVLIEADQELADIDPKAENLMYAFIDSPRDLSIEDMWEILEKHKILSESWEKIIEYLLYYGFIGIAAPGAEPEYIYNLSYNMKLMQARIGKLGDAVRLHLNPAFWPVLGIDAR
jgi:hypothetical protein